MRLRSILAACGVALTAFGPPPLVAAPAGPPPEVAAALARAKIPADALVALVEEAGSGAQRLALAPDRPVNPASLAKLLTTFAALEILGPAWRWSTPVWLDGPVRDGVLDGNLVLRGSGDPTLVLERLWLLLRRVRQAGVREIRGDIVLDRSAFSLPPHDPAAFDGDASRPSNAGADALLLNYRSLQIGFVPDIAANVARISVDVPLAGVRTPPAVPLAAGPCADWRAALRADFSDPAQLRFAGSYPVACGVQAWPVAYADPAHFDGLALVGLWQEIGGSLDGRARDGIAPPTAPTFEILSPPLADVVRDINKYSNNLMAQQLFLTLGRVQRGLGTPETGRDVLRQWVLDRLGPAASAGLVVDNGAGLSREGRITARGLARLLQLASASVLMPELIGSLPLSGIDGTLGRSRGAVGRAHLKTGSLRDVSGIAGEVVADSGRRYVVVAIVNHPNAGAARPALDALLQWVAAERPGP